jgi:DNA-binding response OmpR family regulator
MRLLVVEDDQAIEDFLQRALTEAGYQVDAADDAIVRAPGEPQASRTGPPAALLLPYHFLGKFHAA